MAFHSPLLVIALAVAGQHGSHPIATPSSDSGAVICSGTKAIRDTVGIVVDRKTGAREQSLVEARLAIVSHGNVVGTMYIDDQGMRYIEVKRGLTVPELTKIPGDGTVHPLATQQVLGGAARLRACQPISR